MFKTIFLVTFLSLGLFFSIASLSLSFSRPALAAENGDSSEVCGGSGRYLLGIPSWDRGLGDCEDIEAEEILSGEKIKIIANNVVAIITHLSAFVGVGFIIFGGIKYILSMGNSEQATDARKTIINALIGTLIVIMARVLTEVINLNLTK